MVKYSSLFRFFSHCCFLVLLFISLSSFAQQSQLWGVNSTEGAYGFGTIFYLNTDGTGFTKVHDFDGKQGYPFASLTPADDKLWGMTMGRTGTPTSRAGANHGAIFSLQTDGSGFKNLHIFNGVNGSMPLGELIIYKNRLWGMTNQGGDNGHGVIFSIDMDGTHYRKLHDFDGKKGANPRNSLLVYQGHFYGTTSHGGAHGMGTIFSIKPDGSDFTVLYDFEKSQGGEPESGLSLYQGKFWSMTARGAANNEGSLFSINTNGENFTKHHDFVYPSLGDLIVSHDRLWGMMSLRGKHNAGVVFTMDDDGYKAVHDFKKENGRFPEGNLMESRNLLWGMTRFGGTHNLGVIFSINKEGTQFRKLLDFDQDTGGVPYGTLVEVVYKN